MAEEFERPPAEGGLLQLPDLLELGTGLGQVATSERTATSPWRSPPPTGEHRSLVPVPKFSVAIYGRFPE